MDAGLLLAGLKDARRIISRAPLPLIASTGPIDIHTVALRGSFKF